MKKKLVSVILAVAVVVGSLVVPVSASEVDMPDDSGIILAEDVISTLEDDEYSKVNDEWATSHGWNIKSSNSEYAKTVDGVNYSLVFGWHAGQDPDAEDPSWQIGTNGGGNGNADATGKIVIPETIDGVPVKSIDLDSFRSNSGITEVVLPEGLEYIGGWAFYNCGNLISVEFPSTLNMIDGTAFRSCISLKEVVIPASLKKLASNAFVASGLEKITFAGNAPEILYGDTSKLIGIEINVYPNTTGWDGEAWKDLNIKVISDEPDVPEPPVVVEPTSIRLDTDYVELEIGEDTLVTATVEPADATYKDVEWSVEDDTIASVKDGVIVGESVGTTVVTAKCKELSATVEVKVNENSRPLVEPTGITLSKDVVEIEVGGEDTVTATVEPEDSDFKNIKWSVEDDTIASVEDGKIVGKSVGTTTVTASCREVSADIEVRVIKGAVKLPYMDVNESDWHYSYVKDVFEKGLMTGLNETTFGPNQELVRAQFAVILWRMAGSPKAEYSNKFKDVSQGAFFTDAVMWASENGIVTGYTDGSGNFGSNDKITREQLATMLYRFAEKMGLDTSNTIDSGTFPDGNKVSDFAIEGIEWCLGSGIITGDGGNINPGGNVNRAVCATMISRFTDK